MQGTSMVPILKGKTPTNWRKEHYYHYYEYPGSHMVKRHYGISTERYKLIHYYYDINEWELYDIKADPQEMKNVYDDPAYTEVRAKLLKQLDELRKKLDELNFKVSQNQVKNIREIRVIKKDIAKVMTVLGENKKVK